MDTPIQNDQKYDVFMSYSTKDKGYVDSLVHHLESREIKCWIAPRDLLAGYTWPAQIARILTMNRKLMMILVFSSSTNSSQQILKEVNLACTRNIRIIPIRIEDVVPNDDYQYLISGIHWMDVYGDGIKGNIEAHAKDIAKIVEIENPRVKSRPAPPSNVHAEANKRQVMISWSSVPGATSYNLYWSEKDNFTTTTGKKVAGASNPYAHSDVKEGETYYYAVASQNDNGESILSQKVSTRIEAALGESFKERKYKNLPEFINGQGKDLKKRPFLPIAEMVHEILVTTLHEKGLPFEIRFGDGTFSLSIPKDMAKSRTRTFARFGLLGLKGGSYLESLYKNDDDPLPEGANYWKRDNFAQYFYRFDSLEAVKALEKSIKGAILKSNRTLSIAGFIR